MRKAAEFDVPCGTNRRRVSVHRHEVPGTQVTVFFVDEPSLFDREGLYGGGLGDFPDNAERFSLFSRAVLETVSALELPVDVIHAHDWQTALIPVYLKSSAAARPELARIRTLFTIHNIAYQGIFPSHFMQVAALDWSLFNWKALEFWGQINFLKGGLVFADRLTTVSPRYSQEIQTEEFGAGLEGVLRDRAKDLSGILNGVDTEEWNPAKDGRIAAKFSAAHLKGKSACRADLRRRMGLPETAAPLFGVVSRLVEQKGIDLLAAVLADLVATESQVVVLGQGEDAIQRALVDAARRWPSHVAVRTVFDDALAHAIVAGADATIMPSRWEPCGLAQLYSQLYGAVPVVRRTGGLADTVRDGVTGFLFDPATPEALFAALRRTIEAFRKPAAWAPLVQECMKQDWSWDRSAREYAALYAALAGVR
jgi:starch synthase